MIDNTDVRQFVKIALWVPVILVIWSLAVGLSFVAYRIGRYSELPDLTGISVGIDPMLVFLAVVAAIAGLYWILVNSTFTDDTIDDAVENAEDVKETVDEELENR